MDEKFLSLGQGAAGPYASGPNPYGPPSSITGLRGELEDHFHNLVEGGHVVDKRPVSHAELVRWTVCGPMLDTRLPPQTRSRLFEPDEPCEDAKTCKGFDMISLDLYLKLWAELGARVGHRVGDTIAWTDGTISEIPAISSKDACHG